MNETLIPLVNEREHLMAQYRKKPVVIEAVQLTWQTWSEVCEFVGVGSMSEGKPEGCYVLPDGSRTDENQGDGSVIGLQIPTLEGVMLATESDWIIRGVQGELYPCKPEIFEATYEAVAA